MTQPLLERKNVLEISSCSKRFSYLEADGEREEMVPNDTND